MLFAIYYDLIGYYDSTGGHSAQNMLPLEFQSNMTSYRRSRGTAEEAST